MDTVRTFGFWDEFIDKEPCHQAAEGEDELNPIACIDRERRLATVLCFKVSIMFGRLPPDQDRGRMKLTSAVLSNERNHVRQRPVETHVEQPLDGAGDSSRGYSHLGVWDLCHIHCWNDSQAKHVDASAEIEKEQLDILDGLDADAVCSQCGQGADGAETCDLDWNRPQKGFAPAAEAVNNKQGKEHGREESKAAG